MPGEEVAITAAIAVGGYIGTKLFGAALTIIGDDINKMYVKGRDKIVEVATKKIDNPDDGKKVNLRAARDVLWSGAITEDEVCAEYFGRMLAAARSEDGKDDAVTKWLTRQSRGTPIKRLRFEESASRDAHGTECAHANS